VFGLSLWQILIVVVIAFVLFGAGGFKRMGRKAGQRMRDTGSGIKSAAGELQSSYASEADPDSAAFRAARAGREKATEGATLAVEAAKEARQEIAGAVDDARSSAGGAEPQTAIGKAARAVGDSARDVRAGLTEGESADPQTAAGRAARGISETAKARVEMIGDGAREFQAGLEGRPEPVATEVAELGPGTPSEPPADSGADTPSRDA